jgi:enoyl-CoA hydratase/carnithine racemase
MPAERALGMGLISEVVGNDQLMDRARELAAIIASHPPESMQYHKMVLRMGAEVPGSFAQQLQTLVKRGAYAASNPIEETTKNFLDKKFKP